MLLSKHPITLSGLQVALSTVLGLLWIYVGIEKILSIEGFAETVERHGVLRGQWHSIAFAVPFVEILVGFRLVSSGSYRRIVVALASSTLLASVCHVSQGNPYGCTQESWVWVSRPISRGSRCWTVDEVARVCRLQPSLAVNLCTSAGDA